MASRIGACVAQALENGGIEVEPGRGAKNVEFSAPGRVISTFVA
jgi:hypothetical protein